MAMPTFGLKWPPSLSALAASLALAVLAIGVESRLVDTHPSINRYMAVCMHRLIAT